MTLRPTSILYSRDPELTRKLEGFLAPLTDIRATDDRHTAETLLTHHKMSLLFFDLRTPNYRDFISSVKTQWPETVILVAGTPRSAPLLEVESMGIIHTLDLNGDRTHFQSRFQQAYNVLQVVQENDRLRREQTPPPMPPAPAQAEHGLPPLPVALQHFAHANRHFANVDALLNAVIEGMAYSAGVSRIGIFTKARDAEAYQLRAQLRCLANVLELEFEDTAPIIRWMEIHGHIVTRSTLVNITHSTDRHLLEQALDTFGAEVIIPLHARGRLLGWLILGHRATGLPFDSRELEHLMSLADHISSIIENALLYEEAAVQRTLAETLLHSMNSGIVAIDAAGKVRWYNQSAEAIVEVPLADAINRPIEILGSQLAGYLRGTLQGAESVEPVEWRDGHTGKPLSLKTRRLSTMDMTHGAVAFLHDKTHEIMLDEKQEQLNRSVFWTELAAAMSHEIKNPLVAINTFAQLLPERYQDEDFRDTFSTLVTGEVERLNQIIEQLNDFAYPPEINMEPLDLEEIIKEAIVQATMKLEHIGINFSQDLEQDLPRLEGDERALTEAVTHLLVNAMEASSAQNNPTIKIEAKMVYVNGDARPCIQLRITDEGGGIPPELLPKMYSPFCTTKAQGMGLGLPIAKRTVVDHNGTIEINSGKKGTAVTLTLPVQNEGSSYETPPSCR